MSSEFNAYSSFLGIPEDEQPPHYYRLLGIEPFENDPDTIRQAGKRVINLVKARERGPNSTAARRLRAEITFAATCLLDPKKKAHYDQELEAWFHEYEDTGGAEDEYELEEPDLPMAKIVPKGSGKLATKSKGGSSKSKAKGGSGKGKAGSSKGKAQKQKAKPATAGLMANPKILVLVIVMVVGVLGLGSALAYVFLKSDPPVVAKDDSGKSTAPELNEEEDEETSSKKSEVDEVEEEEAGTSKTEEGAEEKQEENAAEDEDKKTEDPAAENKVAGETKTPEAADPMAATADAAAKTDPAAETKKEEPKQEEPKKEEPKADPKKEEPKQEEPPKEEPKEPFQDLEDALDLPVFVDGQASATPVVLAKVYPKEGERVNVILGGGDAVLGDQGSFSLSGGLLTDPEPKWTVNYTDPSGAKTPIAKMEYKNTEVTFAWTGQGQASINNLMRNCMLKITAGYGNRNLPLRKPVVIEPLAVVMDQKGTVLDLPVVGMPDDEEAVTLEITKLLNGFPSDPTYDPPGGMIKPGESLDIMFAKVDLAFRAQFIHERDGTVKLDFRPMIRGERRGSGPRPLKPYILKQSFDEMINAQNLLIQQGTARYDAFKKQLAGNKDALAQLELKYQEDLRKTNEYIKSLTEMKENIDKLSKEGKVQFRIYTRIGAEGAVGPDTYTLDLLKTKDLSPPPEAEKKPDPKAKPAGKKK